MKPFRGLNIIVELRKIQKGKPYKNHIQTYRTTSQPFGQPWAIERPNDPLNPETEKGKSVKEMLFIANHRECHIFQVNIGTLAYKPKKKQNQAKDLNNNNNKMEHTAAGLYFNSL